MKTIAVCDTDLQRTPLGTKSRLAEELAGEPILRRTIKRLARCAKIERIVVAFPPSQASEVAALLEGLAVDLHPRTVGEPGYRALVQTARKWSLDAWRGGLGGSSGLDEYLDVQLAATIASERNADAVLSIPPGAALIDPALCDAMIEHAANVVNEVRMVFAQAPPGLAPTIYQTALCAQMAANNVPPGWALTYKPDDPQVDLVMRPACFTVPQAVRYASGRLCADTSRSLRLMRAITAAEADGSAESVSRWLLEHEDNPQDTVPREVEIELTTEDPLPGTVLRPRGTRVPRRGPIALEYVAAVADALSGEDDSLVILGGHGDPVLHPQFAEVVRVLRDAGVYGIGLTTTGQQFSEEVITTLIEHRIDVVAFLLDAWTEETFQEIAGGGSLKAGRSALDRLVQARQQAKHPAPITIPVITKCVKNVEELDDFFDGWVKAHGWVTVQGFSHFSQQLEDLSCIDMRPPARTPCRRLAERCVVLADGSVSACDQDYSGELLLGHLGSATLAEIWRDAKRAEFRNRHVCPDAGLPPLCAACAEWHRP